MPSVLTEKKGTRKPLEMINTFITSIVMITWLFAYAQTHCAIFILIILQ
jgi:hypothetical protein